MKSLIERLLGDALAALVADGTLPAGTAPAIQVERTRDPSHGDLASYTRNCRIRKCKQS